MSELIQTRDNRATIRWKLLTSVSAFALTVSSISIAQAADSDHPLIWVELGGELNQLGAPEEQFAPPFIFELPRPSAQTVSPLSVAHPPRFGFGEDAKITFQPEGSEWIFSAAVRYGRSVSHQHLRQQSPFPTHATAEGTSCATCTQPKYRRALQFMDTAAQHSETHAILDFQAGKDVGLGMFGGHTSSAVSLGVRFAQFRERSNIAFKSDPDAKVDIKYTNGLRFRTGATYHSNSANETAGRSFRGVGPSISWSNSSPIAGNPQDGEIDVDWGANAALLFGRQRAKVHHQTTSRYHHGKYYYSSTPNYRTTLYRHTPPDKVRSRNVTVPNVGGFAGLSYRYADAKLSFGYKADFFFGAIDGGIDAAKKENRGFYGPYASISIGLGD
jgi:iron complex outermembrane receptor protein